MNRMMMGFLFAALAIALVGCTTAPVQDPQTTFTKFMENQTKNLDTVLKKVMELGAKAEKNDKIVADMKVLDLKELEKVIEMAKMIHAVGRATKEQGQ